jgi:hypothetical protein
LARDASSFTSSGNLFPFEGRFVTGAGGVAAFFLLFQKVILSLLSPDCAGCHGRNMSTCFGRLRGTTLSGRYRHRDRTKEEG